MQKRNRIKIAQKFESWRQEAIDKLDECRTLVEASSHDLAAVRSLLPLSSAPPRLAPSISASKPMQAALDISELQKEHEEADHSHDTLVLADPMASVVAISNQAPKPSSATSKIMQLANEESKNEIKEVSFSFSSSFPMQILELDPNPLNGEYGVFPDRIAYRVSHASFAGHKDARMKIPSLLGGKELMMHNLSLRHLLGLLARLLDDFADSRSNPFQVGDDDVILAALLAEAIQVLDPDAHALTLVGAHVVAPLLVLPSGHDRPGAKPPCDTGAIRAVNFPVRDVHQVFLVFLRG